MDLISGSVDQTSSPWAKITLFRSLFRGRDDVYPQRFESRKSGRSGYAPACANEWVRGVCEKPRIKCAECPNRRFLAVTDDVIRWHLSGCDAEGQPFVAALPVASGRDLLLRRASISTRRTGATMPRRFSKLVATHPQPRSNITLWRGARLVLLR
jgi:hypothetical protein